MADPKDTRDQQRQGQDQPRHGRDVAGKDDPARTHPFEFNKPRTQAEIVEQAYDHDDPTPTQEENDQAKLDAIHIPDGGGDPQQAEAKRKKEQERKDLEAQRGNQPGYQTRATQPKPE